MDRANQVKSALTDVCLGADFEQAFWGQRGAGDGGIRTGGGADFDDDGINI